MSRPRDSFYRRIDIRRRYTDIDVVDVALHRLASQIERGLTAVQSSRPVAITDYQFGASDGTADTTFPLQVAMDKVGANGGGFLFLPKGTYTISSPLVYNHDNLVIVGEGYGTILQQVTTGASHFTADTRENIGLRDVLLRHTAVPAGANISVSWTDVEESYIQNVFFLDCFRAILLASCDGIDVSHCSDSNTASVLLTLSDAGVGSTDDISIQLNNFEAGTPALTYSTAITGGISPRNVRIEQNRPLPVPSHTVVGANATITRDVLFSAPDRLITLTGAAGTSVDTIEVTFPNDWRIFRFTGATPVMNDALGNLGLTANFAGNAAGQGDTLMLVCGGTNWLEVSRSATN
jgi:hypothetical protein